MKLFSKQNFWLKVGVVLIILSYFTGLISQYLQFDFDKTFGYLDYQHYWQSWSDLAVGKVIYRDFFWEYGILYLVIGLPFFLLLGKTFLASVLIRLFLLPIITIFLSFLLGKELLKKGPLLLFLLLLFLYGVNNDFTSLRHLLPELGLVMLFVGLEKENDKKAFWGSFFLGLSLTSSIEYGIAAAITTGLYFLIAFFRKDIRLVSRQIIRFLIIFTLVAAPYFLFLWRTQALKNFIIFTLQYARSFYFSSPCRELFPRLNEINFSLNFARKLNLYLVPLLLIFLLVWTIKKRKSPWSSIFIPLLAYNLLIFYRTLNTPCVGYMNYSLTFLFLILVFAFFQSKPSSKFKLLILVTIFWFLLIGLLSKTSEFLTPYKTRLGRQKVSETELLPVAEIKLKRELVNKYQQIANFIKEKSKNDDFVYVYPNGPYNQLAKRKSPVNITSTWFYDLVPSLVDITFQQLKQRKPKLIVVNIYNARSLKSALNNLPYNIHSEGKEIIFEGIITSVEDFITQNYEISKKFELAWVLIQKDKPKLAKKLYLSIDKTTEWKISTQGLSQDQYLALDESTNFKVMENNFLIQLYSKAPSKANLMKIPIKVDLGIAKIFSKFIIEVYAKTSDSKLYLLTRQLATSSWQDIWFFPPRYNNSITTDSIIITTSDNQGFFWWGKPKTIEIRPLESFIRNQKLQIDDSAF